MASMTNYGRISPRPLAEALAQAETLCRERRVRLTKIRRGLFEVLLRAQRAMGAYELVESIASVVGRPLKPTTVYRALDFLIEQRLIARISTRNAFVICADPSQAATCVYFICEQCGGSAEIASPDLERMFKHEAATAGYQFGRHAVELQGTCAECSEASTTSSDGSSTSRHRV